MPSSFTKHHRNSVQDYVALDIETIDVRPSTKILSIGVVRVRDGRSVRELELFPAGWELYEIPYGHPTDRALLADMHRQSRLQNRRISEVLRELANFMGDDVIVGQNIARFDLPVINHWGEYHGLPAMGNYYVDLLPLARKIYPELPNHKLETLTRHHRLGRVAHTALSDAVQEHLLYERMKSDLVVLDPNADIDEAVELIQQAVRGKRAAPDLSDITAEDLQSVAEVLRESAEYGTEFDGVLRKVARWLENTIADGGVDS